MARHGQRCCQCPKELLIVPGVPWCRRVSICSGGRRSEAILHRLPSKELTTAKSLWSDEGLKEVAEILHERWLIIHVMIKPSIPQIHSRWQSGQSFLGSPWGRMGRSSRGSRLFKQIVHLEYNWSTIKDGFLYFSKIWQAYQLHNNKIHALAVKLHSISTPWPFDIWAFDLIGPINPPCWANIRILTIIECYTMSRGSSS